MRRASGFPSPQRAGALGAAVYVAGTVAWLALVRPPGPGWLAAWLALTAAVQVFLPGLANQVTMARAYLALPALVYALQPSGLGALAATVAIAGASDLADGRIARRWDRPTQLGGGLDPVVDGVFFGATAIGLALGGAYPWWVALVVAGRYGLPALAGGALLVLGYRVRLSHTFFGQISTALIGVLLGGVALWRGLGFDSSRIETAAEVVIPVATIFTFANLAWAARVGLQRPR